jgi:transcriptional regulator with XRE-family HTH domain
MDREGSTPRDLGYLTKLDPGHLNQIVKGRKIPSRRTALRIAKALDIDPEDISAEPVVLP